MPTTCFPGCSINIEPAFCTSKSQNTWGKKKSFSSFSSSSSGEQAMDKHTKRSPKGTWQHRTWYPTHSGEHNPPGYLSLRFCMHVSKIIHLPTRPGLWSKGIKRLYFVKCKWDFKAVKKMRSGWPGSLEEVSIFPHCLLQRPSFSEFFHLRYTKFCTFFQLYIFMLWLLPAMPNRYNIFNILVLQLL